jgi:hypothetical protein
MRAQMPAQSILASEICWESFSTESASSGHSAQRRLNVPFRAGETGRYLRYDAVELLSALLDHAQVIFAAPKWE